jgi:manganese/zinc/iron transport system permease protein
MVLLSAIFGALSGVVGTLISSTGQGFSTGPTIVLSASFLVVFSLLFAPNRGLFWNWIRRQRQRSSLQLDAVLADLYSLWLQHTDLEHGHSIEVLRAMNSKRGGVLRSLETLQQRGLVRQINPGLWALTELGLPPAQEAFRMTHPHLDLFPSKSPAISKGDRA